MKLLLVLDSAEQNSRIFDYVRLLGFETIWYRHVLKAMDNVEEIAPNGIFVSAADFPRHWKTFTAFIRTARQGPACPIIVIHDEKFNEKEHEKAKFLEVDCLLPENETDLASFESLRKVLLQISPANAWLSGAESCRATQKQLAMIITNPLNGTLIPGKINKITSFGAIFTASHPELTKNLADNTELPACSLRAGGSILSPVCKIIDNSESLSLEFVSFPANEKNSLEKFLTSIS
jgi:hypothetical protein